LACKKGQADGTSGIISEKWLPIFAKTAPKREVLGNVGRLHDGIKALPEELLLGRCWAIRHSRIFRADVPINLGQKTTKHSRDLPFDILQ